MASSATPDSQKLPSKEASQFRAVVRHYDAKQYKKAIKAANLILKKFPTHGETLAMKGLVYSQTQRKEEAYELVKKGLQYHFQSSTCWHVYGLLYRDDRNYEQAMKCFLQANRIDPADPRILRDLVLIQIQCRSLEPYNQVMLEQLKKQPAKQQHWMGYATSYHLLGNYADALNILEKYEGTLKDSFKKMEEVSEKVEYSERLMYYNQIMEESGDIAGALAHLKANGASIRDRSGFLERRASFQLQLNQLEGASADFRRLLDINSYNHDYWCGYMLALDCPASVCPPPHARSSGTVIIPRWAQYIRARTSKTGDSAQGDDSSLREALKVLDTEFPDHPTSQRIALNLAQGEDFRTRVDNYLRGRVRRGVPSLYRDVRGLLDQDGKRQPLLDLLQSYESHLEADQTFPPAIDSKTSSTSTVEAPACLFLVYLLRALCLEHVGDVKGALALSTKAREHTPTALLAFTTEASILKRAGAFTASLKQIETARLMDLADRYLNCKHVQALLRLGRVKEAEDIHSLFTKDDQNIVNSAIYDMQTLWFELRAGEAYLRINDRGRAMQQFKRVEQHFEDWRDDEADYHGYCHRKASLVSYLQLLRFEDRIFGHPSYAHAARRLAELYISLHLKPPMDERESEEEQFAHLPPAERKKALSKWRKKRRKQQLKEKEAEALVGSEKSKGAPAAKKKGKEEPTPEYLLNTPAPLDKAVHYARMLEHYSPNDPATHAVSLIVALHRSKYLPALRALTQLFRTEGISTTPGAMEGNHSDSNSGSSVPPSSSCLCAKADDGIDVIKHTALFVAALTRASGPSASQSPASGSSSAPSPGSRLSPMTVQVIKTEVPKIIRALSPCGCFNVDWEESKAGDTADDIMAHIRKLLRDALVSHATNTPSCAPLKCMGHRLSGVAESLHILSDPDKPDPVVHACIVSLITSDVESCASLKCALHSMTLLAQVVQTPSSGIAADVTDVHRKALHSRFPSAEAFAPDMPTEPRKA